MKISARAKRSNKNWEERDDQEFVATALAVFSMTAPVQAKDVGDWTCEDFLKVPKSAQSRVVYYLVGLNKSQMKEFHDISAKDFNVSISKVVQHCHSNLP
jgi:hypothetical protein